jgi:hypothetical protein
LLAVLADSFGGRVRLLQNVFQRRERTEVKFTTDVGTTPMLLLLLLLLCLQVQAHAAPAHLHDDG